MSDKKQILSALNSTVEKEIGTNVIGDEIFQLKLINIIVSDAQNSSNTFAEQIIDIIKSEYFDNFNNQTLFQYVLDYVSEHNDIPGFDTIKHLIDVKQPKGTQKDLLLSALDKISNLNVTDGNFIKKTALDFCKKQSLKRAILDVADAWSKADYENISNIISEALIAGQPKNSGHNYFGDVAKRLLKDHRKPIPIMQGLNNHIGGGIAGGELLVVLSPTGGGKSMMLVKFSVDMLREGKNVVYYTLELQEKVIGNRIDSCLFNIPLKEVPEYANIILEGMPAIEQKGGSLFIKEFPTGGASVNTIKSHLKILEREHKFIPDAIVIDYADIMKSTASFAEKRHSLTSIYEGLRGLAMEMNVPILTAAQAGRSAINEESFDLKDISESIGKAQTADVIIGLARPDKLKEVHQANMMILKNRSGVDGFNILLNFDTSRINISTVEKQSNKKINENSMRLEQQFAGGGVNLDGI